MTVAGDVGPTKCTNRSLDCTLEITQILYVKYVKYERISLRRWNYSNYAPNTPQ